MNEPPNNGAAKVRCAIYTRKSTSEGLDSDFNTLDAQREAAEYFIRAMAGEGWEALPHRYDDGGFTGANTDRPALKRLLADIEAGVEYFLKAKPLDSQNGRLETLKSATNLDPHSVRVTSP